jgi:hypothetical protein
MLSTKLTIAAVVLLGAISIAQAAGGSDDRGHIGGYDVGPLGQCFDPAACGGQNYAYGYAPPLNGYYAYGYSRPPGWHYTRRHGWHYGPARQVPKLRMTARRWRARLLHALVNAPERSVGRHGQGEAIDLIEAGMKQSPSDRLS